MSKDDLSSFPSHSLFMNDCFNNEFIQKIYKPIDKSSYKYIYHPSSMNTIDNSYINLKQIGKGTFGTVYCANDKKTNEIVALKKIYLTNEKEGVPITMLREINILFSSLHQNIVKLKEIVLSDERRYDQGKGCIYLIFEYMNHDLTGLLDAHWHEFSIPQIKSFIGQLLNGLEYCHNNNILHRDIKGSNLLVNNEGILKLADFGLARFTPYDNDRRKNHLTNRVITLWYRPPELLLGSTDYTSAADMWSVGCIIAELLCGKPLFQGKSEIEQIEIIYKLCGTPNEDDWPELSSLSFYSLLKPKIQHKRILRSSFNGRFATDDGLDLMDKLLVLNPAKRLSASEALAHPYFKNNPLPCIVKLHNYKPCHELHSKALRKKRQRRPDHIELSPPIKYQKDSSNTRKEIYEKQDNHIDHYNSGYKKPPNYPDPYTQHVPQHVPQQPIIPGNQAPIHPSRLASMPKIQMQYNAYQHQNNVRPIEQPIDRRYIDREHTPKYRDDRSYHKSRNHRSYSRNNGN